MARMVLLTFRIHRFEVLLCITAMLLMGAVAAIVAARLTGVGVPEVCFRDQGDSGCRDILESWLAIRSNEAPWLLGVGVGMFPVLIGLVLGVPVVARELEVGSAALAWSLEGDRRRWLMQRLLPMLVLALAGLVALGVIESGLLDVANPWDDTHEFDELGSQGPTFVARGLMALGIAVLGGAVIGRTWPTFLVTGLLGVLLVVVGAPLLYLGLAVQWSDWRSFPGDAEGDAMLHLRHEEWRHLDGRILDQVDMEDLYATMVDPDPYVAANITYWQYGLPYDRFGDIEVTETVVAGGIGVAALLLTFPVVRRRRPPS